jgi:drug/metabolite transporter (DMT)-like permease
MRFAAGVMLAVAVARGRPPWRSRVPWLLAARCSCNVIALSLAVFVYASTLPIANVAALAQLRPVFLALGGLWLGERVGPQRWLGIGVGFLGALIVIRPGSASFDPIYFAAIAGVIAAAMQWVLSRKIQPTMRQSLYCSGHRSPAR